MLPYSTYIHIHIFSLCYHTLYLFQILYTLIFYFFPFSLYFTFTLYIMSLILSMYLFPFTCSSSQSRLKDSIKPCNSLLERDSSLSLSLSKDILFYVIYFLNFFSFTLHKLNLFEKRKVLDLWRGAVETH